MAHVEDLWLRDDGERRPRHGKGKRYRVRWVDPGGHERSKSFQRKTDADRFRSNTETDLEREDYVDPKTRKVTLRQFSETWLASQTFGESTREATERRLRLHIWPVLGDKLLRQITPSVIQAWIRGMDAAPSSAQVRLTLLSSILGAAQDDGLIAKNQTQARSVKAPRAEQHRIEPWSAERVATVRAALPDRFQAMADCGAGLGMRQGEVLGLAVEDVDFLRRVVHVRRQVKIVGSRLVFGLPKSREEREVPLPDEVGLRLAAHIAEYPPAGVTLPWQAPGGKPVTAGLVFTSRERKAIDRNSWNRYAWHVALEKAGMATGREAGFHQLRHHFASTALYAGCDVRSLADWLGHGDPGFTLRVYSHMMPAAPDKLRQAIDASYRYGTTTAQKTGNA
jgi:integrase